MAYVRNCLLIALAILVQGTISERFAIFGIRPDFAMLALLFVVNGSGSIASVIYGFLLGFFQDIYSPESLGVNAFTMSLTAYLLDVIKEHLTVEHVSVRVLVAFIACIIHDAVYLAFYTKLDGVLMGRLFIREDLPGAAYTALLLVLGSIIWEWAQSGGLAYVVQGLFRSER